MPRRCRTQGVARAKWLRLTTKKVGTWFPKAIWRYALRRRRRHPQPLPRSQLQSRHRIRGTILRQEERQLWKLPAMYLRFQLKGTWKVKLGRQRGTTVIGMVDQPTEKLHTRLAQCSAKLQMECALNGKCSSGMCSFTQENNAFPTDAEISHSEPCVVRAWAPEQQSITNMLETAVLGEGKDCPSRLHTRLAHFSGNTPTEFARHGFKHEDCEVVSKNNIAHVTGGNYSQHQTFTTPLGPGGRTWPSPC